MTGFLWNLVETLGMEVDGAATVEDLKHYAQEGAEASMNYADHLESIIRKLCTTKGATLTESEQSTLTSVLQGDDFESGFQCRPFTLEGCGVQPEIFGPN